jgi:hypothetical protein
VSLSSDEGKKEKAKEGKKRQPKTQWVTSTIAGMAIQGKSWDSFFFIIIFFFSFRFGRQSVGRRPCHRG